MGRWFWFLVRSLRRITRLPEIALRRQERTYSTAVRRKKLFISRKVEVRTLAVIVIAAAVPVLATIGVVVGSSRPILSDLVPTQNSVDNYTVLRWSDLLRESSLVQPVVNGGQVRALGYMADDERPFATASGFNISFCCQMPETCSMRRTGSEIK